VHAARVPPPCDACRPFLDFQSRSRPVVVVVVLIPPRICRSKVEQSPSRNLDSPLEGINTTPSLGLHTSRPPPTTAQSHKTFLQTQSRNILTHIPSTHGACPYRIILLAHCTHGSNILSMRRRPPEQTTHPPGMRDYDRFRHILGQHDEDRALDTLLGTHDGIIRLAEFIEVSHAFVKEAFI